METAFYEWSSIIAQVVSMLLANVTTAFIFGTLIISIFVSVIASLFYKGGERRDTK